MSRYCNNTAILLSHRETSLPAKKLMATHLEQSLQRDIDLIRRKIVEMSSRAESALKMCVKALQEQNRQLAYSVILRDQYIDDLEKQVDRLCLEFMVRQQPVAGHLRFVYATIKINAELERIGDYAESIARQILKLKSIQSEPFYVRYIEIANLSIPMLHDAVQAFVDQNADLARETMEIEEKVDGVRNEINAELLRAQQAGQIPLEALTPLMTIARRFERVSDQAKNICEEVLYMCTGEYVKHKGTEVIRILFVDLHNSCRSQIAEAIGNSLGQPQLLFASAGLSPKPIDPRTVALLKEKDIDISRQTSKSIEQIPNFDHYQVIVALDKEAKKVFPAPPAKTVCLDWNVTDPSAMSGSEQDIAATYENAYRFIREQIEDLSQAILDDKIE
jgi:phosphate transport system protein